MAKKKSKGGKAGKGKSKQASSKAKTKSKDKGKGKSKSKGKGKGTSAKTASSRHTTPTVTLSNGVRMPVVGFGTWQLEGGDEATEDALENALQTGYRHIDTAALYGNEVEVGVAMRNSNVEPGQLFVTTKLWGTDQKKAHTIKRAYTSSTEKLNVDKADLYLVHYPVDSESQRKVTWRTMCELYRDGRVRSIGVSNYDVDDLEELAAMVDGADSDDDFLTLPHVNQIPFNPWLRTRWQETVDWCKKHDVVVQGYYPVGGSRQAAERLRDDLVGGIGRKHGRTPAQVLIRWQIQKDIVPLPRSANRSHIRENFDVFGFELDSDDMDALDNVTPQPSSSSYSSAGSSVGGSSAATSSASASSAAYSYYGSSHYSSS